MRTCGGVGREGAVVFCSFAKLAATPMPAPLEIQHGRALRNSVAEELERASENTRLPANGFRRTRVFPDVGNRAPGVLGESELI